MAESRRESPRSRPLLGNQHRLLSFVYLGSFEKGWKDLRLSEDDLRDLEGMILKRPEIGVIMEGTGGLRKCRFAPAKGGGGKSGSERVCYAFFPFPGLVLMVTVFGKDDKDNLSPAERSQIKAMLAGFEARLKKGGSQ